MRRPRINLVSVTLLIGVLLTLALAVALIASGHKSAKSGDRSRNGLEVVLRAKGGSPSAGDLRRSVRIMSERLKKSGAAEFDVRARGSNEIVLSLDRRANASRTLDLVTAKGQLEFFDLETSLVGPSVSKYLPRPRTLYPLLKAVANEAKARGASVYYLFDGNRRLLAGPSETKAGLPDAVSSAPGKLTVLALPSSMELVSCDRKTSHYCPGGNQAIFIPEPKETVYYLFRLPAQLTNKDLNAGGISADFGSDGPIINLSFTDRGNEVFREITRDEWTRGNRRHSSQHFAVVLDGRLMTFPQIDPMDKALQDGIDPSVNGAVIQGILSVSEAGNLATVLKSGALPASFDAVAIKRAPVASGD